MNDDNTKQLSKKTTRVQPKPEPAKTNGRLVKGSQEAFERMRQLRLIRDKKKSAAKEAEVSAKSGVIW